MHIGQVVIITCGLRKPHCDVGDLRILYIWGSVWELSSARWAKGPQYLYRGAKRDSQQVVADVWW